MAYGTPTKQIHEQWLGLFWKLRTLSWRGV